MRRFFRRGRTAGLAMLAVGAIGVAAACGSDDSGDSDTAPADEAALPEGAELTLSSAAGLDLDAGTVTLPLEQGAGPDGEEIFYVVTESSDAEDAESRGVNPAPKLENALGTAAVQEADTEGEAVVFPATPNFAPERAVTPGPDGFPPDAVTPGADGGEAYSPLVTTDGETVLNAAHVANDSGQHDSVVALDEDAGTVTLKTLDGFTGDEDIVYLRLDASADVVAALEESTFAPALSAAPAFGSDAETSALSPIIPVVNGIRDEADAAQQGLEGAVLGGISPRNIQATLPGDPAYSPLWDISPAVWSEEAVANGERDLITSAEQVAELTSEGAITSGGEGPRNPDLGGLRSAELISNCPTVAIVG